VATATNICHKLDKKKIKHGAYRKAVAGKTPIKQFDRDLFLASIWAGMAGLAKAPGAGQRKKIVFNAAVKKAGKRRTQKAK